MSDNKGKQPAVVAELGRPETPEETANRKAKNSRLHRERQTTSNLIYALLASLAVVLLLVLIVPRGVGDFEKRSVDVQTLAEQAEPTAGLPLAAPELPDTWLAKQALIRSSRADRITHWYIGYTTAEEKFSGLIQAFTPELQPANETWVANQLENKLATGTESLADHIWTVYEHTTDNPDETNVTFAMSTELDTSMLVVFGTASPTEIKELAEAAIASLEQ